MNREGLDFIWCPTASASALVWAWDHWYFNPMHLNCHYSPELYSTQNITWHLHMLSVFFFLLQISPHVYLSPNDSIKVENYNMYCQSLVHRWSDEIDVLINVCVKVNSLVGTIFHPWWQYSNDYSVFIH